MKRKQKTKKRFRIRKKKPIYKKKFFWTFVLTFVFGVGFFYFLFFSPVFQIKEVQIRDNQKVLTEEILSVIQSLIETKLVFSTKSIFLVSSKNVEEAVLINFPQIESVELKKELPATLFLSVEERKPLAVFCEGEENCFLVDRRGVVFEPGRGEESLIVSFHGEGDLLLGQQVIEPELIQAIVEIKKGLNEQLNIETERLVFLGDRLSVRASEGFNIYFSFNNSVADQIFNLDMVLKEKITPEERAILEYIDLRFGSKVYYR